MPQKKQTEQRDLIRDVTFPFSEARLYYTERLSSPAITQKERMSATLRLAFVEQTTGNVKRSEKMLEDCEKYILSHGLPEERCTFILIRAIHMLAQAQYDEAMPVSLRAWHMAQQLDIPILSLRCLAVCGRVCLRLFMYTEAMDYMSRGLELARSLDYKGQVILFMYQVTDIGREFASPEQALKDAEELIAYREAVHASKVDIADVHIAENAARASFAAGDLPKAKQYAARAVALRSGMAPNQTLLPAHHLLLASICSAEGDEKGMLKNTKECLDLAQKDKSAIGEQYAYGARFDYYITHGKLREAKKYLDAAAVSARKINTALSDHMLDKCYLKYYEKIADKARELEYMKKIHEHLSRTQQQVITYRIKHINVIHELELLEKENEIMKKELNLKSQELNLSNHYLQQRNELLTDLKSSINDLKNENSKREVVFQTLFRKIDVAFNKEENEKDLFKAKFDTAHADFIRSLSSSYPTLSSAECRICALLHSGFNTKEIATLLSTTLRNIETHRLNIRKKLKLKRADNLQLILAAVKV